LPSVFDAYFFLTLSRNISKASSYEVSSDDEANVVSVSVVFFGIVSFCSLVKFVCWVELVELVES